MTAEPKFPSSVTIVVDDDRCLACQYGASFKVEKLLAEGDDSDVWLFGIGLGLYAPPTVRLCTCHEAYLSRFRESVAERIALAMKVVPLRRKKKRSL